MTTTNYIALTTALFLVALIIGIMRWLLAFKISDCKTYPTPYEVVKATDKQLYEWFWNLKTPENEYEVEIFNMILQRYNEIENV